ncbi:Similar to Afdn: Afadin (Mus musculus) [Cotesia congregata]|uniref:Similar to Afdn: Afadin (Mus musculus) n=1 Tax=Cotesia congregata TaxID=51543 RepID=A0A8J2HFA9_COTCN|nr:Similar to Afdn: Afadin (Mus musculus) [Cotesia congregata]
MAQPVKCILYLYIFMPSTLAAEYLVRTGPTVTLEVAKQGAIYHGLATLLSQPSPSMSRGTFSTDTTSQLDVFGHDGDTFSVDSAKVSIFKKTNEVSFASFLEGQHCRALES